LAAQVRMSCCYVFHVEHTHLPSQVTQEHLATHINPNDNETFYLFEPFKKFFSAGSPRFVPELSRVDQINLTRKYSLLLPLVFLVVVLLSLLTGKLWLL